MLTSAQRKDYEQHGYTYLRGAFERAAVEGLAERVWEFLEGRRGVRRDEPGTWTLEAPWAGLKELRSEGCYLALQSDGLRAAIDDLLGAGSWGVPRDWGGFLVSFPDCSAGEWTLPVRGWHVDYHFTHEPGSAFGVRVHTFLSEVGPRGGGTLVVHGSHRLVQRFVSALSPAEREERYATLLARFNASDPWLAELSSGNTSPSRSADFMERAHELDGVPVRVGELTGGPGDAVLFHPWLLHVTAPNTGPRPRFMLGKTVYGGRLAAARR